MACAGIVCMLHLGRSGSTVLGDLLDQNPYVGWDGEIYEPGRQLWRAGLDPVGLMQTRAAATRSGFYGFELKPFHARLVGRSIDELVPALAAAGVTHWLVLKRRNYLRKLASTAMARVTKQWHRRGTQAPPTPANMAVRVRIDPQAHFIDAETRPIREFFEGYDRFFAEVDDLLASRDVLRLSYEGDLQHEPAAGYRKVCRFLDVAPMPVTVRYAPTTPFALAEVIENLADVQESLHGTSWAWMAEDGGGTRARGA